MTELSDGLQAIFERHRDGFQRRAQTLEAAITAVRAGSLDEALRAAAQRDAHKLVGSLGTFGLHRASDLARELELRFATSNAAVQTDSQHLAQVLRALRHELAPTPRESDGER